MNARLHALQSPVPVVADVFGRPMQDLRVSVIETCNYRCPYCMPEGETDRAPKLSSSQRLDFDDIETAVRGFASLGVRKVRLTGGEPLLRKDLPRLIERLARVPGIEDLALTTNGSLLAGQARALKQAGLHRLTVSLDALDPALFRALSGGRGDVSDVLAGIAAAEAAGFTSIKLNVVIQRGVNEGEALAIVSRFRGSGHVVRFIEYMDVGSCNGWQATDVVPSQQLHAAIDARWPLRPMSPSRPGEVARRHAFVDGAGEIGFISSISNPFCGDCNRARLSADGQLFTCLFAGTGTSLRDAIRIGEDAVSEKIAALWSVRRDRYSELRASGTVDKPGPARKTRRIEMFYIGG